MVVLSQCKLLEIFSPLENKNSVENLMKYFRTEIESELSKPEISPHKQDVFGQDSVWFLRRSTDLLW